MAEGGFTIKQGDRLPYLTSTIQESGTPINFESPTKALAVKLVLKKVGGAATTKTAEFKEAKGGILQYKWTKADTEGAGAIAAAGEYEYEWLVEWASEELEHFPNEGGAKTFKVEKHLE
jgi:hypothetical protein